MLWGRGLRAVLVRQPWLDRYELYMGGTGGKHYAATHVQDGAIVYSEVDDHAVTKPFLTLDQSEVDALAKALLAEARPEDATLDALKDARSVRDRLLAFIEKTNVT